MISLWIVFAAVTFIYSYGFVDFNLTLSSRPLVMNFVTWSQQLAMFNRPLSTCFYLVTVLSSYLLFFFTLRFVKQGRLLRFPWKLLGGFAFLATLSYPFLSSDVFKYLFSARMVVDYGLNPHAVSPNLVPGGDLWLRFMRWIHTPSPYGPSMTGLAIPYYLLGFKKFVPTLYLFKLGQAAWYFFAIWLIGKLAFRLKLSSRQAVFSQFFFAFNPLVIFEWLVNAHNDAPMITLLLLALYFFSRSQRLLSFLILLLSAGIKYATIIFLPFIFLKKKLPLLLIVYLLLLALTFIPHFYHYSTQFQPWYLTWLVPLAALTANPSLLWMTSAYTLGGLLRYYPFIHTGLWQGTPQFFAFLTYSPLLLTIVVIAGAKNRIFRHE